MDSRLLEMPFILCKGTFFLWPCAEGRSRRVAFALSPSMLPSCCSPWAGGPLWTGRVAGEPPKSASVTAEAGKLPTLNVRPFWPFQVVALGLPSMIVMGSPGSILRAPGSETSLKQRPSGGQACRGKGGWACGLSQNGNTMGTGKKGDTSLFTHLSIKSIQGMSSVLGSGRTVPVP